MNNRMYNLINNCEIISFDVFDTLILRKCESPKEVFKYAAGKLSLEESDFAVRRIEAERELRQEKKKEITIREIYSKMTCDPEQCNRYIAAEEDAEMQICVCNSEMKEIYDWVKKSGKTIYIISDMYMNLEFMDHLLRSNGYDGFEKLYVSSEFGITKSTGKLYSYILQCTNISASSMFHIGDNFKTDYFIPKLKGIKSYWYRNRDHARG